MQVALYRPHGPVEGSGEGFHLRPAQAALVVGVVSQAAVGRDDFSRNARCDQVLNLRDTGKLCRHSSPSCGGCASADSMIESAKAAGSSTKVCAPPLLYCFVNARTLADRGYPNQRHHQSWRALANFYRITLRRTAIASSANCCRGPSIPSTVTKNWKRP